MSSSSSEDEAVAARRQMIARARASAHNAENSSSSEESSSSDDNEPVRLKPMFVPKNRRITVFDREERERIEAEAEQRRNEEAEEFREKQRENALKEAAMEEQMESATAEMLKTVPPIGIEASEEEYQKWILRELKRILWYRDGRLDVEDDESPDGRSNEPTGRGAIFKQPTGEMEDTKFINPMVSKLVKKMGGMKDI